MFNRLLTSFTILMFAGSALATEPQVTLSDMHVRPTAGKVGVAFFTANSTVDDAITHTSSDCCEAVEIHRTDKLNGVMSMRRIAEFTLAKNEATPIQPDSKGGEHMMLIGLKKPLNEGDTVKVTFTFKKSPVQTVNFPVKADAAPGAHELH